MRFLYSVLLSIGLSVLATYLLRRVVTPGEQSEAEPPQRTGGSSDTVNVNIIVVPVILGNTWMIGAPAGVKRLGRKIRRRLRR